MIAGHYATALVAKEHVSSGSIAFYLGASQLPDLAWYSLGLLGMAPIHSHDGLVSMEMLISHDLVPTLGWMALATVVGRATFGAWRPGLVGGALVGAHLVADVVAGYPHYVLGPESPLVGTGLYFRAPYLAVGAEALFAAVLVAWVARKELRDGRRRGATTWLGRALVFGGGIGATFLTAPLLAAFDPNAPLEGAAIAALLGTYGAQIVGLSWSESRPVASQRPPADVPRTA